MTWSNNLAITAAENWSMSTFVDTEDGEDVSKSFFHLSETLFDASLPVCETLFSPAKQATVMNVWQGIA